jgi:hypothetical protein
VSASAGVVGCCADALAVTAMLKAKQTIEPRPMVHLAAIDCRATSGAMLPSNRSSHQNV